MAHFAVTLDPDSERRQQFARQAAELVQTLRGLTVTRFDFQDLTAITARNPTAPCSEHQTPDQFGFLLGYAVGDDGQWLNAEGIAGSWTRPDSGDSRLGGYFAAATCSKENGFTLGGDLLGFFPIYWANCGGALIAASSPELIAAHPAFRADPDPVGIAGILLINSLLNHRALLRGVRRLPAGHHLRWNSVLGSREVEVFSLFHLDSIAASPEEARASADAEMLRAIRWHRPTKIPTTLMLSGGLDSRLMASYLVAENITDRAVTLGRVSDLELQVARRVISALNWNLQTEPAESDPAELVDAARQIARWEQLSGGFSHLDTAFSAATVGLSAPMFWSGFALEDVLGGDAFLYGWDPVRQRCSYESLFSHLNAWGVPPNTIGSLLNFPGLAEEMEHALNELKLEYHRCEGPDSRRAIVLKLLTRARHHVGSVIHRLSFRSWPLLPILDRRLLETQLSLPADLKRNRALQKALLTLRSVRLARIPREHNSFLLEPIHSSAFSRTTASLGKRLRRWYWQKWNRAEPRRYYRCYDLNSAPWMAVRREAEQHRGQVGSWIHRAELDRLLPPADKRVNFPEPISGSGGARLLLGLLLWSGRH